jgi:hypothetical protein
MRARVPVVEVADQGHLGGIRRPDCELRSVAEDMGTELFVQARVRPLAEQVEVVAGQSYWAVKGLA